jgi:hypothetical protein
MKTPLPEARAQVLLQRVVELYARNLASLPEPRRWLAAHRLSDRQLWEAPRTPHYRRHEEDPRRPRSVNKVENRSPWGLHSCHADDR